MVVKGYLCILYECYILITMKTRKRKVRNFILEESIFRMKNEKINLRFIAFN